MTEARDGASRPVLRVAVLEGRVASDRLEEALEADLIVASPDATIDPSGAVPSRAGTPGRLVRRLGPGAALGFWSGATPWDAKRALAAGLVDAIDERPGRVADTLRANWERVPFAASALATLKRSEHRLDPHSARRLERALFSLSFADDRPRAGARAFLDRREDRGRG